MSLMGQPQGALFQYYSVTDGLTDKTIHCIFQDSRGWIWIGTDFGVLRFDGYRFNNFNTGSSESDQLSKSLIRTIFEDSNGIIWIGTEQNGLFKYKRQLNELINIDTPVLNNSSIWSVAEDTSGKLLIATENGINYFNPEKGVVERLLMKETTGGQLSDNFIRKVLIDDDQNFWFGTGTGVSVFNNQFEFSFNLLKGGSNDDPLLNQIWDIFQDANGFIWIGTYLDWVYIYDTRTGQLQKLVIDAQNDRSKTVRSIQQEKSGSIWLGTRGGLYLVSKQWKVLSHYEENILDPFSLGHNSVLSQFIDAKGDLWVGTRNGISYLNFERKAFEFLNTYNCGNANLNNGEVYALWEDGQKRLWIGTENGGVNIYDPEKGTTSYLTIDNGLSNNCIKAIAPDQSGNVLIGTYLGGLNRYDPKTGQNYIYYADREVDGSISDNSVWAIYTDDKNQIWVGTSSGLDLFNESDNTFTHFGEKYQVGWVSMIFKDNLDRMWLYSVDLKQLTMVDASGNVRHLAIQTRAMADAEGGKVWISTLGGGLVLYDPEYNTSQQYTVKDGICSDVIYGMVKLNDHQLWLSTNNGLSAFDVNEKRFRNFYVSNGLLNNQFNYGAFMQCTNGCLAFGGKNGVDFVYLDKLKQNTYVPPVVLTDFLIFNRQVNPNMDSEGNTVLNNLISETKQITLPFDQNMITFEFAALDYSNIEKNTYRYKLEGFDKAWNEIGTRHSATYTNLDDGDYVFRVIGANSDGAFDPEGLSVQLTILPPFWRTWLFRFIIMGVLLLLFYAIYGFIVNREMLKQQLYFERKNAHQIQELDRQKHQFFMNISHEIRTPLALITGPLEKLFKPDIGKQEQFTLLGIIQRNTRILTRLVNQLLDYRKLETGNLKPELKQGNLNIFLKDILDPFKQMATDKGVEMEFNASHSSIFFAFDPDKLEKILNNVLSNAIKYTNPEGKVTLSVSMVYMDELENVSNYIPPLDLEQGSNQYVRFTIRDTGVGIPENQISHIFDRFRQVEKAHQGSSGFGIGLSLTKELIKLLNGHIKVKSIEGKGTKFSILIPYKQIPEEDATLLEKNQISPEGAGLSTTLDKSQSPDYQPIILIIDDNPDLRLFVRQHFEGDYQVLEASDGKQGWEQCLSAVPDLVIADIMMPLLDGVELCRKIKNDERTSHIPIMLLTAVSAREKQIEGISAGADDYIVKPFDIALLKAKADNLLYIRKALRDRFSKTMFLKPKDIVLTSPDEKFLRKVIQVIEKNISQPDLDVDFLARQVGVSRTQLYRKMHALTDMAVKEFVRDIRLKRAEQLLLQDKITVSEIAVEVGFNDMGYFRKCFKEKYGKSPSKYQSLKT